MPKKYNIAIDISPLNDGNSTRGVGYYTKNLVNALQREVKTNPQYKNFSINLISNSKFPISNYDLVHYPYFDPFFLTLPPKHHIPQIITIHDLIPRQFKQHFPVGLKGEIKWLIQRHRARTSDYILTVSRYSQNAITEILNYPKNKIYFTYEAADSTYHSRYTIAQKKAIVKKYHLPPKFILNNGDINWNKNIPSLVKVCHKLGYPLVLVGSASTKKVIDHPWNQDILWVQSQKSPILYRLGHVPDADLPLIYHLATIYCQPSFAEGFGLSIVKAMQTGTPVIYSQQSSLPEVMGDCGVSFDPYKPHTLENSLGKLWNNQQLLDQQKLLGVIRAKQFDWKYTAIQTLNVYNLALNK